MQRSDLSKPDEKKKLLVAGILGLVAILFLWWTFVGFGSSSTTVSQKPATPTTPAQGPGQRRPLEPAPTSDALGDLAAQLQPVDWPISIPSVPEPKRNIFAYYEPPPVVPKPVETPTPTPTPSPPILLAAISPSNVYARTADFTLEVAGDKFTPDLRIFVDGRELVTKYKSPQQLSALIAATTIANPGVRQVVVRTPDGRLYSLALQLTVAAPPTPNYTYVGIYSTKTRGVDIAYVQDRNNKDILSVQRGDVLSGRFRVTSISDKELVLVDSNLKIKHSLAMTEGEKGAGSPLARPTPRVDAEDDEP